MALPEAPNSRSEQYLAKIAGQETELPEAPNSRVEQYLEYIAENGTVSEEEIAEKVSTWLEDNIHEDPTVVIDASLSVSGAAADSKAAGDAINGLREDVGSIEESLGAIEPSNNLLNPFGFVDGYYSSGVWTDSSTYITSDYIDVEDADYVYLHMFNLNNGTMMDTSRFFEYVYWFNANKEYVTRASTTSGTVEYEIPDDSIKYARVMGKTATINGHLSDNKGFYVGIINTASWVAYSEGGIPNYVNIINAIESRISNATVSLLNGVYTIKTNHAQYTVQRITEQSANLDTYRLYKGYLRKGNILFKMWENSDAEGAIGIYGETDFVCGFHGSEIMTSYSVFKDGVDITSETAIDNESFNTLMIYVDSDVYHCYKDQEVANRVAFKRSKIIKFDENKVTISNSYIAQENLDISSARIALFQCYKNDGNTPVFTNYSVNSDFKNYAVDDINVSKPSNSESMTEATLNTIYANITFKSLITSGQAYEGSVTNFESQNRIKFYFDTIARRTSVADGEQIRSQFEVIVV